MQLSMVTDAGIEKHGVEVSVPKHSYARNNWVSRTLLVKSVSEIDAKDDMRSSIWT